MSDISSMKEPYRAVVKGNWNTLIEFFGGKENNKDTDIFSPMTVSKDTVFHIAVHSKNEEPLKSLLERVSDPKEATKIFKTNGHENTVLHEAAINGNIAAVELLVEEGYATENQLLKRNGSGQTPLFKAASFGKTKVVRYLARQTHQMASDEEKLRDEHRVRRKDGISILHAAVRGEHFGTALELLKLDEGLAELKTKDGKTSLHYLTAIESAFRGKYKKHWRHKLLYFCAPTGDDNDDDATNIEDGDAHGGSKITLETINKSLWKFFIAAGWATATRIWKEKRKCKFAFKLAHELIKKDKSWEESLIEDTMEQHYMSVVGEFNRETDNLTKSEDGIEITMAEQSIMIPIEDEGPKVETPLLTATRKGMIEIVKEILEEHPQAVEYISHKKQNILHVAASYRQREVFELVNKMQIPRNRLIMGIDNENYSVLQHVADTSNYRGGTRPGPAYQLQEELEWYRMVEDIMPSFFIRHVDKNGKTAEELFKENHSDQLKAAQRWIKETSQSCSAVAVLVSTLVFAAVYTVPGGFDEESGDPKLLGHRLFLFFIIADVISLSCSLTSVVMFLSILTSPFELEDFHLSLPRRLTLGFALLFMSMVAAMFAFMSTILLIIKDLRHQQFKKIAFICCAAFFPVSVLALRHFPLFASFINSWKHLFEELPCGLLLSCLSHLRNKVRSLPFIKKKGDGFLNKII